MIIDDIVCKTSLIQKFHVNILAVNFKKIHKHFQILLVSYVVHTFLLQIILKIVNVIVLNPGPNYPLGKVARQNFATGRDSRRCQEDGVSHTTEKGECYIVANKHHIINGLILVAVIRSSSSL